MSQLSKKNEKFSNKKNKVLNFDVEISDLEPINSEFSKALVKIMYADGNRNGSYFDKNMIINKMIPTLFNIPVVGHYLKDKDDFGSHDSKLEINSDGTIEYIDETVPYGVVNESSEISWKLITETNGAIHDYLCCSCILWTGRYPQVQRVIDEGNHQSMEVNVFDGYDDKNDGLFHVTDAEFSALTILGENIEPCFESSTIEKYSLNKEQFKQEFSLMLSDIKEQLSFIKQEDIGSGDKIEIDLTKDSADFDTSWGSVNKTSLKNKILKASNYKALVKACYLVLEDGWEDAPSDKLKFPVCLIKDDKLVLSAKGCESALSFLEKNTSESYYSSAKSKLKKYYKKLGLDTSNFQKEENIKMNKKEIAEKFSLTYEQLEDEVRRVLATVTYVCDDYWYGEAYECRKYWLQDYDENFVYVYDCEQDIYVKLPYAKQGDDVTISFDKASRVKTQFVDWQGATPEGEETVENDDVDGIGEMEMALKQSYKEKTDVLIETKVNEAVTSKENELKADYEAKLSEKNTTINDLTEKFNKASEYLTSINTEVEDLKAYKLKKVTEEKEFKFAEYAEELSEEEIKPIKNKIAEFSLEEIDTKLKLAFANKNHKPNKVLPTYNNMGIEKFNWNNDDSESKTDGNVWDRLKKKNKNN